MFKRILKIISIVLASFVVIVGGAVGIVALTGGFEKEEINISKLYFDNDPTLINKQIRTLEDVVARIDFEPKNATNKVLEIDVEGNQNGIIADLPDTLTAGEDFRIKLNKDEKGNNIGGVVTIKAKQGIAPVSLTIVVDVDIPDNALYFAGDSSGKLTLAGKNFTMPISTDTQYVYLKSNLVNAFHLQANNENMKNAIIGLTYYDKNGKKIPSKSFDKIEGLTPTQDDKPTNGRFNYYYKIPVVTDEAGTIEIFAKTHRTSEIEAEFKAGGFENLEAIMNGGGDVATLTYAKYIDFLHKYMSYFDNTIESYEFFKDRMSADTGRLVLDAEGIVKSLNYVYVSCKATIDITAIKLDDFTSVADHAIEFNVFTENFMSVKGNNAMRLTDPDTFNLNITTNNEDAESDAQEEKEYLLEKSLELSAHLYLNKDNFSDEDFVEVDGEPKLMWQGSKYKYLPVYGFNINSPITTIEEMQEKYEGEFVEGMVFDVRGYLIRLVDTNEYVAISKLYRNNETQWKLSCNVPLPTDPNPVDDNGSNIYKALYIGFEVSGIDSENNEYIKKNTFSRIYVNYDDYVFESPDVDNLAFNDVNENMAINTNIIDADAENFVAMDLPSKIYEQEISVNLDNLDCGENTHNPAPTYTSIMYFAESTSNTVDDKYQKIATVGKYKFINFTNANQSSDVTTSYLKYDTEDLIGERIATYNSTTSNGVTSRQYYIRAINASTEPVRLFAVAYLSDKNGNPIDINGRTIDLTDEDQLTDETALELVVIRISDFQNIDSMPSITINNFVDNMNFYTKSLSDHTIDDDITLGGFLNRNVVNYYKTEENELVSSDVLTKIQKFLVMKLLKDNTFTLYLSNLDFQSDGSVASNEEIKFSEAIAGKEYEINVDRNKQIAFTNLCKDLSNYELHLGEGGQLAEVPVIRDANDEIWDGSVDNDPVMIEYVITSSSVFTSAQRIYLDPTKSTIPYSSNLMQTSSNNDSSLSQEQKLNCAEYVTNEIIINDVNIINSNNENSIKMQNKVYADFGSNNSGLKFVTKTLDNGGAILTTPYTFPLQVSTISGVGESATQKQHVWFEVYNNLIVNGEVNADIVDCSQNGTRDDIDKTIGGRAYLTIEEYVEHYVGVGATEIQYTNPVGVITLESGWTFNNHVGDTYGEYIYFGSNKFKVENGSVNINGYVLPVTGVNISDNKTEYQLNITSDQYFPVVASGDFALIYNELFKIHTADKYYIYDYVGGEKSSGVINVKLSADVLIQGNSEKTEYVASDYMDDSIVDYGALKVADTVEGDTSTGTINFKHGEVLGEKTGNTVAKAAYTKDVNGEYKKLSSGEFVKAELGYTGDRYSPKGINVYLIITFNMKFNENKEPEKTVYKVIEYEVVQEDVELVGYNGAISDINSATNRLKLDAGNTYNIYFKAQQGKPRILSDKFNNFFDYYNHQFSYVTITHSATTIAGLKCETNNAGDGVELTIPNLIEDKEFSITLTYRDFKSDEYKTFTYYISVNRNVVVDYQRGTGKGDYETVSIPVLSSSGTSVYAIELASGIYNISDIITTYINNSENETIALKKKTYGNNNIINDAFSSIDEGAGTITLNTTYAEFDGSIINKDFAIFDVCIMDGNTIKAVMPQPLYIRITPTYIIDKTDMNGISIYNGENIFVDYLKLFDGSKNANQVKLGEGLVTELDKYDIFTIVPKNSSDSGKFVISNGSIKYVGEPLTADTSFDFRLTYTEVGQTITTDFSVTIKYVNIKAKVGSSTDFENITSNISIDVNPQETNKLDVSNYLTLEMSGSDEYITVVLIDESNNIYTSINTASMSENKTYRIGYAKFVTNTYVSIEEIAYTFTINIVSDTPGE